MCVSSHLFPDEEVAEETAHLSFSQGASRERVIVAWQEVDTQDLNITAVQRTARTQTQVLYHYMSIFPQTTSVLIVHCRLQTVSQMNLSVDIRESVVSVMLC